jgi:serine/threonine protein kinase
MNADRPMSVGFSGELLKQNAFLKNWKRYFYEIQDDFFVEKDVESHQNVSRCQITNAGKIERLGKRNRPFTFQIIMAANCRPLIYAADTEESLSQWIAVLNEIKVRKEHRECPNFKLGLADFEIVRILGRGTYGKVALVKHRESGQLFAMKAMSKALLAEDGNIQQILAERDILLRNQHPFLVAAHFTFQTDSKIFLLLDYVPGGELFQRLREERRFTEDRARLIAAELLLAIGHLHKAGFVYRDLKPENILFDENGHVKLTDFGYAKNLQGADRTSTFCGTADYLAPEVLLSTPYTKAVDWWSLGCVIYEMLVGVSPFYNANLKRMYRAILNDEVRFPATLSATAKDLITKLLTKEATRRLGSGPDDSREIQNHIFFCEVNWQMLFERKVKMAWKPGIQSETDTSHFASEFTTEDPVVSYEPAPVISTEDNPFENFTSQHQSVIDEDDA